MKQFQNLLLWNNKEEANNFWKYIVDGRERLED